MKAIFYESFTYQHVKKAKTIQKSDAYLDRGRHCQRLRGAAKETFCIGEFSKANKTLHFIVDWGNNLKF